MPIVNRTSIFTADPDDDALSTVTPNDLVINFASLITAGDLADGIFVGADGVSVRNFGSIHTSGLGAAGVHVEANNVRVDNFGSITTSGNDTAFNTSDGIIVIGDAFRISNFGDVHVTGDFASALVGVGEGSSIVNAGHVTSSSIESIVVGIIGDGAQVINRGQIEVAGSESSALLTRGEHASIINFGQVILTGGPDDEGMTLNFGNSEAHNHGSIVVNGPQSFGMLSRGAGQTLDNDGSVTVHGDGCIGVIATGGRFSPVGTDIQIINSGQISIDGTASFGVGLGLALPDIVDLSASHGLIRNSGSITTQGDGDAAIVVIGDSHALINSGTVTADGGTAVTDLLGAVRAAGTLVSGDNVSIENERTGSITSNHAGSAAIELNVIDRVDVDNAQLSSVVDNWGLIQGVDVAISGGDGQETVINHGRIVGDVQLGDGADEFVFGNGGTLAGNLFLGGGDDLVRVERGSGTSVIEDFAAGPLSGDLIDVSDFFSTVAQLTAHSHSSGNDLIIDLGPHDQLILKNVSALDPGDFLLV